MPLATVSGVSTTSYDDVTAFGGVTYYYQVAAVNARGERVRPSSRATNQDRRTI